MVHCRLTRDRWEIDSCELDTVACFYSVCVCVCVCVCVTAIPLVPI